jgi:hypothetical protein
MRCSRHRLAVGHQHHRLGDVGVGNAVVWRAAGALVLLYSPLVVTARLLWRYRTTGRVDRPMAIAKCRARGRPLLRRVK